MLPKLALALRAFLALGLLALRAAPEASCSTEDAASTGSCGSEDASFMQLRHLAAAEPPSAGEAGQQQDQAQPPGAALRPAGEPRANATLGLAEEEATDSFVCDTRGVDTEICDFNVRLRNKNSKNIGSRMLHSYSRCFPDANGKTLCLGEQLDWTSQSGAVPSVWNKGLATFEYLQTAQFVLSDKEIDNGLGFLYVDDKKKGTQYNCMAAYWKDQYAAMYMGYTDKAWDFGSTDPDQRKHMNQELRNNKPVHLTLVPFARTDGKCEKGPDNSQAANGVSADAARALGVFITREWWPSPSGPCHITDPKDPYGRKSKCFNGPYWRFIDGGSAIGFVGSLYDRLTEGSQKGELFIYIDQAVTLKIPVNSLYVKFPLKGGNCKQKDIDRLNSGKLPRSGKCIVGPPEQYTVKTKKRIAIGGFGRITGFDMLYNRAYVNDPNDGDPPVPSFGANGKLDFGGSKGRKLGNYAEYWVKSGLVVLSSQGGKHVKRPGGAAIDIAGPTVAFGPKRHQGSVVLNAPYSPVAQGKDKNSYPVKLFDMKVLANWIDAADGPEVMGNYDAQGVKDGYSWLEALYLHVNDDAIKAGANSMQIQNIVVLKGNSGGVVCIGSYGYNRGTASIHVDGVWVHRITHNTLAWKGGNVPDASGLAQYDDRGGVITSRTCPVPADVEGASGGPGTSIWLGTEDSSKDWTGVENLYVAGLGYMTQGATRYYGPNSVVRTIALGFQWKYSCQGFSSSNYVRTVNVGNIYFKAFSIYVDQVKASLFYNELPKNVKSNWYTIYMGVKNPASAGGATARRESVIVYPSSGEDCDFGYYVCGAGGDAGTQDSKCWNTCGKDGDKNGGAGRTGVCTCKSQVRTSVNLEYNADWYCGHDLQNRPTTQCTPIDDDQIKFPYGR